MRSRRLAARGTFNCTNGRFEPKLTDSAFCTDERKRMRAKNPPYHLGFERGLWQWKISPFLALPKMSVFGA